MKSLTNRGQSLLGEEGGVLGISHEHVAGWAGFFSFMGGSQTTDH
jgi:hypothetical protein